MNWLNKLEAIKVFVAECFLKSFHWHFQTQ